MEGLSATTVAALLAAVALGSGIGAVAAADPTPAEIGSGAQSSAAVVRCTKLYRGAQPLRLPADRSDGERYGAFRRADPTHFVTRAGTLSISSDISTKLADGSGSAVPGYSKTVYLATAANGAVTPLKPAVTITESAILGHVFGGKTLEGRIGAARRDHAKWSSSASDMGTEFYPSVATLLGKNPLGSVWRARIHGVPSAGPALDLRFVTGGGSSCH